MRWLYGTLHIASFGVSTECVKELLAHGADTYIKTNDGKTPLDKARDIIHDLIITLLVEEEKRT